MLKLSVKSAKKLESFIKETCSRNQLGQFIDHVRVLDYLISRQQTTKENRFVHLRNKDSNMLGMSNGKLSTILNTLQDLNIIVSTGSYISGSISKAYKLLPLHIWDGHYFNSDSISSNISRIDLPNNSFYKTLVRNMYNINFPWKNTRHIIFDDCMITMSSDTNYCNTVSHKSIILTPYSYNNWLQNQSSRLTETLLCSSSFNHTISLYPQTYSNSTDKSTCSSNSSPYASNKKINTSTEPETHISNRLNEEGIWMIQPVEGGRVYSTLTSMKRDLRKGITWGSKKESVYQADFTAAQVFLAYLEFVKDGNRDESLEYRLTKDDFYNSLIQDTGISLDRDDFKKYFMSQIMYSSTHKMEHTDWSKKFYKLHPEFWDWIYNKKTELECKETKTKGNSAFSHFMAKSEFEVIEKILKILYVENHQAVCLHDALVFPESTSIDLVVKTIKKVFADSIIQPKIKIEAL